jgi:hypothetical protein
VRTDKVIAKEAERLLHAIARDFKKQMVFKAGQAMVQGTLSSTQANASYVVETEHVLSSNSPS